MEGLKENVPVLVSHLEHIDRLLSLKPASGGGLSYSEITQIIGKNTVNYDKTGQTKWFKNGGDLVTYNDKDTWA